jgi:hypothetical protein
MTQLTQMMDDVPFNPFPKSTIKGSAFVKEPFFGGGTKKLKRQLANERRKNSHLDEALRTQDAVNKETSARQRAAIAEAQRATADSEEKRLAERQQAAIVSAMEKNAVKKTVKEDNEDSMADILMGVKREPFAVAFTTPKYETENALMTTLYSSVTKSGEDTGNWGVDPYPNLTSDDYVNFRIDVETTFNRKHADISDQIVSLRSHQAHYRSVEPLTKWIGKNQGNLTNELKSLAIDTETNERRAEYENQVVEANKSWKVIVTVMFVMAVCVFLFYSVRELRGGFSWGKVWSILWRLVLMGLYLLSVDYVLFQFWALVRYSLDAIRRILHV